VQPHSFLFVGPTPLPLFFFFSLFPSPRRRFDALLGELFCFLLRLAPDSCARCEGTSLLCSPPLFFLFTSRPFLGRFRRKNPPPLLIPLFSRWNGLFCSFESGARTKYPEHCPPLFSPPLFLFPSPMLRFPILEGARLQTLAFQRLSRLRRLFSSAGRQACDACYRLAPLLPFFFYIPLCPWLTSSYADRGALLLFLLFSERGRKGHVRDLGPPPQGGQSTGRPIFFPPRFPCSSMGGGPAPDRLVIPFPSSGTFTLSLPHFFPLAAKK